MSPRKMVNRQAIAEAAWQIVEAEGSAALSMRTLASKLGIKAPSLYDHVKNRDEIIALLQTRALEQFGQGFAAAGDSVREKVLFYREWALANPNIYPVVFQQFLQRELITPGLESRVLAQVVAAAGGSHIQARAMWAHLHGLVDLQLQNRLPADADTDATWEHAIRTIENSQR
jgi:AcrR family transcriptional regulator